jgi:hypothetical protein
VSLQDTKERIFRNGQIYSRPRFGGSVHGPDTRPPFRPDSNPYDVPPEPRGYGQGSVPETGKRDFLYQYLEQNKEVMGPKTQMFDRYADPDDGTLISAYGPEVPKHMIDDVTERIVPGYKERRDALRKRIAGILRGV